MHFDAFDCFIKRSSKVKLFFLISLFISYSSAHARNIVDPLEIAALIQKIKDQSPVNCVFKSPKNPEIDSLGIAGIFVESIFVSESGVPTHPIRVDFKFAHPTKKLNESTLAAVYFMKDTCNF